MSVAMNNTKLPVADAPTRRRPNYALVIAMMSVVFAFTLYLRLKPENIAAGHVDVRQIPRDMGNWKYAGDPPSDPALMKQIGADSYLIRHYKNSVTGQEVELYVVYRRYGRREFNHNPDQCFPSGGFRLVKKNMVTVPYAGQDREASHMLFDGSGVLRGDGNTGVPPTTVTYFFASGDKTEAAFYKQQLQMVIERLVPNKNGWALLRMTSYRTTTDADALAAQQDFLRTYGQSIHDVLTTDGKPQVSAAAPASSNSVGS